MNRLLGIVLDVEYLFTCVHKEEDADTKQVYFYLFKVRFYHLKKAFLLSLIVQMWSVSAHQVVGGKALSS